MKTISAFIGRPAPFAFAVFALLTSVTSVHAGISPAKTEINLGAFPVDQYQTVNNGTIPSCTNALWTVRNCIESMFNNDPLGPYYNAKNYVAQGVTGVRFFFALGGGKYSTPWDVSAGPPYKNAYLGIRSGWLTNLNLFFNDLKTWGIVRVTPTPVIVEQWSGGCPGCFCPACNIQLYSVNVDTCEGLAQPARFTHGFPLGTKAQRPTVAV